MKNEKWLIYVIVGFTSITTVLLLMGDSLLGFVRAVLAAVVLDWLIAYWEGKRTTLKDDQQRKISTYMMWAGVGIVGIFALGFAVEYNVPVDATQSVDMFGYTFAMTLTNFILMLAAGLIGSWLVLTLGVVLYMRGIDPEIKKDLELTKALQDRDKEEMDAYREALKVTARQIGTEKAVKLFRENLSKEGYNKAEIDAMEVDARHAIVLAQGGIPVNSPNTRVYSAESVTVNPTPPSTQQK